MFNWIALNIFFLNMKGKTYLCDMIHFTAYIHPSVHIGKDVHIGPFCRIGLPAEYRDYDPEEGGRVFIDDGTIITGGVCIDSGRDEYTYIGPDCFIMSNVHIGHDCLIRHSVTISPGATIGGLSKIQEDVNIGMNACIHQKTFIPKRVMIGMGAVVTKSLKMEPGQTYAGNPAKHIGPNKRFI
jgi:UDP-N-acetylglucosamine acyltransferase